MEDKLEPEVAAVLKRAVSLLSGLQLLLDALQRGGPEAAHRLWEESTGRPLVEDGSVVKVEALDERDAAEREKDVA